MTSVFAVTLPFFALPCMLLRYGENTPIHQLRDPAPMPVYAAAALLIVAATVRWTLSPRLGPKDAAFGAFVAAFPNNGFMGVPLIVGLLGADAAGPVITSLLVDLFVTSSLRLALARAHDGGGGCSARAALGALRGALSNPLPWSIALGALLSAFGWQLPAPLQTMVRMHGDAASPVALFTIGAVLWRARQHSHSRTAPSACLPIAAFQLLLHPALVYSLGLLLRQAGLPLNTSS